MNIEGRRVLVTGASRGLGRALALAFAKAGAREVLAGARRAEDFDELKRVAVEIGASITPIKLDVTNDDDVKAAG
jgi:3-oxoacyl-[acyl-carrier protein] reductase